MSARHQPGLSDLLTGWLRDAVPSLGSPLRYDRLPGGRSNLTYLVSGPSGRAVVRRPPLGAHPGNAHDVLREARLLSGLAGAVPVPAVLATCEDTSVLDAPFAVLEFLDGLVVREPSDVPAAVASIGPSLVDTLAALHAVDPERVGLGGLVSRKDHLSRQLARWFGNWRRTSIRPLPALERAHDVLVRHVPPQLRTAIVHGDYRLDNCVLTPEGEVRGVLDWELTTVGDPLADLGQLLVYWAEPGDTDTALHTPPTVVPGFATRSELLERYARSGASVAGVEYHVAFNWWKTACIVENVYTRVKSGDLGATDRSPDSFAAQAERLADRAWREASALR
ncbi:phosphotransferase family protein [Actinosynnema sp. NPDC020468]|uniref:phosphotransferase family protein n=1 Tax=Actinosynnema sp. NPDC020468 TaxID=3154488 RepID=UPI0033C8823D